MKSEKLKVKNADQEKTILLDYGSGGKRSHNLISKFLLPAFNNKILAKLDDCAVFKIANTKLSFSTDSFVVDPIFFPGGDIGELSVYGTVNDISMSGAKPLFISLAFIIEEGFPLNDLEKIIKSIANASKKAGVEVVTGDTKVVQKGAADKIFINTSGIGIVSTKLNISGENAKVGDKIIINGSIGDHGTTILLQREKMNFKSNLKSDTAPLNHLIQEILETGAKIHTFRDPTRGGLATTLNEIAEKSNVGIKIFESTLPIKNEVQGFCELLGLDPLYIANEGKLIVFCPPKDANLVLKTMQKNEYGKDSCIIGEVIAENNGNVFLETKIGGLRRIDMLVGAQLPRIC